MTSRFLTFLIAGTALAVVSPPAVAGNPELELMGDGSATNNRDLLRGAYECGYDCSPARAPREPFHPPFDIDWSVALRGSYVQQDGVSRFETSIVPALTISHEGLRSTFDLDGEAEIIKASDGVARLAALRLAAAGEYGLDEVTNFATEGDLSITQAAPSDPNNPTGTAISPIIVAADASATLTRDIGIAYVGLRGSAGRTIYGNTTLVNATVVDNSGSSNTRYGAGLRVSHQLTPILSAFADAGIEYRVFDAVSPTLLVKLDSTDYVAKAGLTAEIGNILEAEGAVGVGLRQFADGSLADIQAALYEASLTFRPDETLEVVSAFSSTLEDPGLDGLGTASIEREASIEARYKVNTWWSVWAAAGWFSSTAIGATDTQSGYDLGVGSEYRLNAHVALTADYEFSRIEDAGVPPFDTHKATVGVKVSR